MPKHLVGVSERAKTLWVAGFLEGEGTFDAPRQVPRIRATQKQRQPLTRLQYLVGGSLHRNSEGYWVWDMSGMMARALMLVLRPLLSPWRRAQVRKALG